MGSFHFVFVLVTTDIQDSGFAIGLIAILAAGILSVPILIFFILRYSRYVKVKILILLANFVYPKKEDKAMHVFI